MTPPRVHVQRRYALGGVDNDRVRVTFYEPGADPVEVDLTPAEAAQLRRQLELVTTDQP